MTASWEPTSRASTQGRSSSLRSILGCEVWGGTEHSSGHRRDQSQSAEIFQEGGRKPHRCGSGKGKRYRRAPSGPTTCHSRPKFHSPPPLPHPRSVPTPPPSEELLETSLPTERGEETDSPRLKLSSSRSWGLQGVPGKQRCEASSKTGKVTGDGALQQRSRHQLEPKWPKITKPRARPATAEAGVPAGAVREGGSRRKRGRRGGARSVAPRTGDPAVSG